jgi:hypothetical protein
MSQTTLDGKSYDLSSEKECEAYWAAYGRKHLLGKKVSAVRYLGKREADEGCGWSSRSIVIVFDDGTMVFPSRDDEGNDAGALFGQGPDGESLTFPVLYR